MYTTKTKRVIFQQGYNYLKKNEDGITAQQDLGQ